MQRMRVLQHNGIDCACACTCKPHSTCTTGELAVQVNLYVAIGAHCAMGGACVFLEHAHVCVVYCMPTCMNNCTDTYTGSLNLS